MYTVQQALITHLKNGRAANYNSVAEANIKPYAGELIKEKITQLTTSLPVLLVFPQPSKPLGIEPMFTLDLIAVTRSDVFDKQTNINVNMQLNEDVYTYLSRNPTWQYAGFDWLINRDTLEITNTAIDNKFAIVIISMQIKKGMR